MNEVTKSKSETMQAMMPRGGGSLPATQAASVEHTRAMAQVQAACVLARQNPRDEIGATHKMRAACANIELAIRAFFKYSRGESAVTGGSIHLATEIARCWGNLDYGIVELARDDFAGESEMMAYAWDLETNMRVVNTFVVPHKRDKKGGPQILTDMRDIYENNANNAARRLRECIFRVLPKSYVEEAKKICTHTIEKGDDTPIEKRREQLLQAFAKISVSRKQLEDKMRAPADKFTPHDIAILSVIMQSIRNGETTVADEFDTGADAGSDMAAALKGAKTGADEKKPEAEQEKPAKADTQEQAEAKLAAPKDEKPAETKAAEPKGDKGSAWLLTLAEGLTKAKSARDVQSLKLKHAGNLDALKARDQEAWEDIMAKIDETEAALKAKEEDDL